MDEVVGRTGHMSLQPTGADGNREYVEDTVTVRVERPGGWVVFATDQTKTKAISLGLSEIARAKDEFREQIRQRVVAGVLSPEEAERLRQEADL